MFAFQYLKASFTEICKEVSFLSFFRKMLMSAFLLRFKANYLEKMHGYPQFFSVESNSPFKDILFPHGANVAQKPWYLVNSVLKLN